METWIPHRPWQKVGTDLFEIKGRHYLVTVDCFSLFFEVDYLPDTTSQTVITKLRHHFARHGIPDVVISDGGPQYTSSDFDFRHITSPGNNKANGAAKVVVKIAKTVMQHSYRGMADQPSSTPFWSQNDNDDALIISLIFLQYWVMLFVGRRNRQHQTLQDAVPVQQRSFRIGILRIL